MAAGLGVPTADFIENRLKHNEALYRAMSGRPGSFILEGGHPLKVEGKSVGGVGVSGSTHEDDAQVSAAVAAAWDALAT
jgi:glc operon protein GlcG